MGTNGSGSSPHKPNNLDKMKSALLSIVRVPKEVRMPFGKTVNLLHPWISTSRVPEFSEPPAVA